jgi:glycosyltransferase involved in cell wall biosynthesis
MFSRIFGRKSVVIAGGWDVVSMPEIGYGLMNTKNSRIKASKALNRADRVIAVSISTREWVLKWVKRDDVIVLYHGFDAEKFVPSGEKENLVLSVGNLINETTINVKGLESLKKAAELLPGIKFVLIGNHDMEIANAWRKKAPPNLEILDFMSQEKLMGFYQRAKVYVQPSYQESFGCALAEAMLCECVPVVTKAGALPEVVGDTGFYAKYGDVQDIVDNIKKALASDMGGEARKMIMSHFPLEKRVKGLYKIIDECMKKP